LKDKKIGFIGLGNVGSKIAVNITNAGFILYVHDLNKNAAKNLLMKGAIWCDSIETLLSEVSIIITCLPTPKAVNEVVTSMLNFFKDHHLWIEMSTTDENEIIRLSKLCETKGSQTLEAPITGGQHRAESGNISILVGGKRKNFERAFTLLSSVGHEILYCGNLGRASTLKVVTNYLASINLIAISEALMVCKKYGLDLSTAFNGIRISSGNSFVNETETQVILNGSYDAGFTMDLACKDLRLFDKLINKFNIPSQISKLILQIFENGRIHFGNRSFSTSIVKKLEETCKTNLRAPGFPKQLIDKELKKKGIEIKF
jgi:3-hydroxyisobutyrate dehydrogenase